MVDEKILEAIKEARESKKRNFKQSFDLIINLKNIDLRKAENKIKFEVNIPHLSSKKSKIGVIVDSLASKVKDRDDVYVIKKDELENLGKNKKQVKNIAKECSYFIAEAPLMPLVGKSLGPVLAPRNLMPRPIPPTANIEPIIDQARKSIRFHLKDAPVVHLAVGTEDMDDKKIAENVEAVIERTTAGLPKGREQIKNFIIKLTMGKPIKFVL